MKRIYINENRCLGCRLCEWECAFANSGLDEMFKLKGRMGKDVSPRIRVEGEANAGINFAVNCRHCNDALCVKSCIAGALSKTDDGMVVIDKNKCVGCFTCVMVCPFGAIMPSADGRAAQKCMLCMDNQNGEPNCVKHCPNNAIAYEER
ncbi:MAG: 4Fe-4S binding protein [Clostridiales bacterium]|nr:4Fe-4S binding protein [Clostridiales bacterium]